ncbi:transposase [bacterium]|nr:transposase [bacterium]
MSKINQDHDGTLGRNNIKYMLHLVHEYELTKKKKHATYRFVTDFYNFHKLKRQNFIKYYNRFKLTNGDPNSLLPAKRGPRYNKSEIAHLIENKVIELRSKGYNRSETFVILKDQFKEFAPLQSTIYNIYRKNNMNKLRPLQIEERKKIIKEKAGELAHIDCHYLPKGIIENDSKRYFLVACMDDATRITWAVVSPNVQAIHVMFASLKILNTLNYRYQIAFQTLMSDNGGEFGSGKLAKNKESHPFELMLQQLGIKHIYTRPYRPQTNGKIERFWKTINEELLEEMVFDSVQHLEDELQKYLLYYNEIRPHSSLDGKTPKDFSDTCERIKQPIV